MKIDKEIPLPYYAQLKEILLHRINNNMYPDGRIESDRELARIYDITPVTVRKALSELKNEGLIYKIKGVGTFIKKPKLELDVEKFLSLGRVLKDKKLNVDIKVLKKEVVDIDEKIFLGYSVRNYSKKAILIERVRYVDDEPVFFERDYYNNDLCKSLIEKSKNGLIYNYLINSLGISFSKIDEYLKPIALDPYVVKNLKVDKKTIGLRVVKIAYDSNDNWIEFSNLIVESDKVDYHIKIK